MFLRKIEKIEYKLPNSPSRVYRRDEIARGPARQVSVIGQNNGKDEKENWLIFDRPVSVPGETKPVYVEVSFRLEAEDMAGKNPERIIKVQDSPLVVFFPTEKATRFGFLIQGPYRTMPSRDNIPKDDEWNETLVKETAELIGDILSEIKDLGLLSVSFLEALPIRTEDFPDDSMFYPIVTSVRNALTKEDLLPADDGSFVSAGNAKLARGADLRKLLTQVQLGQLFQSTATIKWLAGDITQDRTPDLRYYLISELDVEEVTPDVLARKISHAFLSVQPDEWFFDFYGYLSGQEALWRSPRWERDQSGVLRSKPILRLEDGSQETPFKSDSKTPNVFLPPPEETAFPVVNRSIVTDEQARTFLKRLGLSEPDVFDDIVERVLPKYTNTDEDSVPDTEHRADIHKIVRAMCSDSEAGKRKVIQAARRTPFLKATNPIGNTVFKRPAEIYLNTAELRCYFSGVQEVWFLHDEYTSPDIDISIWHNLGVFNLPRKLPTLYFPPHIEEGSRYEPKIENYDLDGLEHFLYSILEILDFEEKKGSATVLWNILQKYLKQDARIFKATYKWFYYSWKEPKYFDSMILARLKNSKWVPTKDDSLEKPGDITTGQLLDEFLGATELIGCLGIVEEADQQVEFQRLNTEVKKMGFSSVADAEESAKMIQELGGLEAVRSLVAQRKAPVLPKKSVAKPGTRGPKVKEAALHAPSRESVKKERAIQENIPSDVARAYLRDLYTNENDELICQCCRDVMPFKIGNDYYFEAVQCIKDTESHYCQNRLALCPTCAAMYRHARETEDDELRGRIVRNDIDEGVEFVEIPVRLAGKEYNLYFVGTHWFDLRAIFTT